jgi:hypothetical protein
MKQCPACQRVYDDGAAFCTADAAPLVRAPAAAPPAGRVVGGRYRVERLLGRGGMGSVYEATQIEIGRRVALKLLNRELVSDPQAVERFRREARAAGRLQHPNAVTIYDFGIEENGEAFLAMELLDGPTLRDELRARAPLSPREVVDVLAPVADAVDAAHAEGIIHRDLKPDNIMLVRQGDGRTVKVLDFGIAKLAAPEMGGGTLTGTGVIGTPFYMSPEQGEGVRLDARSDVYALGVIAFEMLTGQVPFRAETPVATVVKHINTPPPRPSSFVPSLAGPVEAAVLHALEKDPARRPQTARALVDELRAALGAPALATEVIPRPADPTIRDIGPVPTSPTRGPAATPVPTPPTAHAPAEPGGRPDAAGSRTGLLVGLAAAALLVLVGGVAALAYALWGPSWGPAPGPPPAPAPAPEPTVPTPRRSPAPEPPPILTPEPGPAEPAAPGPAPRPSASASSFRAPQGPVAFRAELAVDGRRDTGWCEGAPGPGVGESLTLAFPTPVRIARLRVQPGYFKSNDRWDRNNRVATASLRLSDGRTLSVSFQDVMREQVVPVGGGPVTSATLVVESVYYGGDREDTLISEIAVEAQ